MGGSKPTGTDKDLEWEEIEMEHIVRDQWIDFRKSTYRYPDGIIR